MSPRVDGCRVSASAPPRPCASTPPAAPWRRAARVNSARSPRATWRTSWYWTAISPRVIRARSRALGSWPRMWRASECTNGRSRLPVLGILRAFGNDSRKCFRSVLCRPPAAGNSTLRKSKCRFIRFFEVTLYKSVRLGTIQRVHKPHGSPACAGAQQRRRQACL